MEQIISPLTIKEVKIDMPKVHNDWYKDTHTMFWSDDLKYIGTARTRYNDVFYYYLNDTIIGNSLRHYGEYTEQEIHVLNMIIQQGWVVYDIGANIGYHTLGLAERAEYVFAFEPNKQNYDLLVKNTQFKKNVTLFKLAVSDSIGQCYINDIDVTVQDNYGECKVSDSGQLVETVTIDSLVEKRKLLPPNLVKIDVEGHEYNVIKGMDNTIRENLPVIFYENMHGDDLGKIYDYLTELNYKIYWFPCMNYNPNNFYKNQQNIFGMGGVMNALAVPWYVDIKTNLLPIISNTDTWADAVSRHNKSAAA